MPTIAVYIEIMKDGKLGILQTTKVVDFSYMEMHKKGHKKSKNACHIDDDFCHWTNVFNLIKREDALSFSIKRNGNGTAFEALKKAKKDREGDPESTPFLHSAHLFIQKFDGAAPESTTAKPTDRGVELFDVQVTEAIEDSGDTYSIKLTGAKRQTKTN